MRRSGADGVRISGIRPDLVAQFAAYHGYGLPGSTRVTRLPAALLNVLQSVVLSLLGTVWVVSRLRLGAIEAKALFLAADYIGDPRDFRLYKQLEEGGSILLVKRMSTRPIEEIPELTGYAHCRTTDGAFDVRGALNTISMIWKDGWRLFVRHRDCQPALFYRIAALADPPCDPACVFHALSAAVLLGSRRL